MGSQDRIFISEKNFKNRYQYTKDDLLGEGGFAQVYKAYDRQFEEYVALKFYSKGEQGKYDVISEMRDSRLFSHKNIIRVHDAFVVKFDQLGTESYIQIGSLELANGGNLRDFIRTKPSEILFIEVILGILRALEYLHMEMKIIHRDLSPENILMYKKNEDWIPKVTDFGISKKIVNTQGEINNKSTQLLGKVDYMAPEQFHPEKFGINGKLHTNVDLWSFGIILYELFTHQKPFSKDATTDNPVKIIQSITTESPHDLDQIPDPYKTIIKKCLQKKAAKRVQDPNDLIQILEKYKKSKSEWGIGKVKKGNTAKSKKILTKVLVYILLISSLGVSGYFAYDWYQDYHLLSHVEQLKSYLTNRDFNGLKTYYSSLSNEMQLEAAIFSIHENARNTILKETKILMDSTDNSIDRRQYEEALLSVNKILNVYDANHKVAIQKKSIIEQKLDSIQDAEIKLAEAKKAEEKRKTAEVLKKNDPPTSIQASIKKTDTPEVKSKKIAPKVLESESTTYFSQDLISVKRTHKDQYTKLKGVEIAEDKMIVHMEVVTGARPVSFAPKGTQDAFYIDYNNRKNRIALKDIRILESEEDVLKNIKNVELIFDKLPDSVDQFNLLEGNNQIEDNKIYRNYIGIKIDKREK